MDKEIDVNAVEELEECRIEIEDQLEQIKELLQNYLGAYQRAERYWIAHIESALRKETKWLGGSFVTMDDTLNEIREFIVETKQ